MKIPYYEEKFPTIKFPILFDFLPLKTPERLQTTQKPRRDDNEQVTYDLTVLFSLIFVLNL